MSRVSPGTKLLLQQAEERGRALKALAAARLGCLFHRAFELPLPAAMELQEQIRCLSTHIGVELDENCTVTVRDDVELHRRGAELWEVLRPGYECDQRAQEAVSKIRDAIAGCDPW